MAFSRDNLVRIGGANSSSKALWMYASSTDNYAAISAADYFLSAINELKLGDKILIESSGPVQTLTYIATNNGVTIDIATGLTITA